MIAMARPERKTAIERLREKAQAAIQPEGGYLFAQIADEDAARDAALPIVYLKMEYPADLANAGPADRPNRIKHTPLSLGSEVEAPNGSVGRVLVRDTWNTAIIDELAPAPED